MLKSKDIEETIAALEDRMTPSELQAVVHTVGDKVLSEMEDVPIILSLNAAEATVISACLNQMVLRCTEGPMKKRAEAVEIRVDDQIQTQFNARRKE